MHEKKRDGKKCTQQTVKQKRKPMCLFNKRNKPYNKHLICYTYVFIADTKCSEMRHSYSKDIRNSKYTMETI